MQHDACLFSNSMYKRKSNCICISVSELFYLAQCPPASSMLSQIAKSFLRLNNIPLCVYICTIYVIYRIHVHYLCNI